MDENLKKDTIDSLEQVIFDIDGEPTNNQMMLINIVARLKSVVRDIKRYL